MICKENADIYSEDEKHKTCVLSGSPPSYPASILQPRPGQQRNLLLPDRAYYEEEERLPGGSQIMAGCPTTRIIQTKPPKLQNFLKKCHPPEFLLFPPYFAQSEEYTPISEYSQ